MTVTGCLPKQVFKVPPLLFGTGLRYRNCLIAVADASTGSIQLSKMETGQCLPTSGVALNEPPNSSGKTNPVTMFKACKPYLTEMEKKCSLVLSLGGPVQPQLNHHALTFRSSSFALCTDGAGSCLCQEHLALSVTPFLDQTHLPHLSSPLENSSNLTSVMLFL